jgi:outer membrane protein OmpA-like peptidoglycan-associated protein
VELHLSNGTSARGATDLNGEALVVPTLESLFQNAQTPRARVLAPGVDVHVDLSPLIQATRTSRAAEWAAAEGKQRDDRGKVDAAIRFAGKIYRDRNAAPLVDKCEPGGPEKCGDGIDNDCNGRYDETQCGYGSGVLQWTLTWEGASDLDLYVEGPDGVAVSAQRPQNAQIPLRLDRTCAGSCPGGNVENALVPADTPPKSGTYHAWVVVNDARPMSPGEPIRARLSGRVGAQTWYTNVKLAPMPGAEYRMAYPVGSDADYDGVEDSQDACPTERGCFSPTREYRGCPDTDRDGVPDTADACPKVVGYTQSDPKKNGCPVMYGKAGVTNLGVSLTSRIEFEFAKAELSKTAVAMLKDVAEAIKASPIKVERLAVDGHTDDVGDEQDNINLSHKRVTAVVRELEKHGIDQKLLLTRGFGETKPIADNATKAGRAENRRVEFVVLRPERITPQCW